jgi:hypothetical protein
MVVPRTDGFVDPCIPTLGAKPPSGADWVHEIKHDGYRLIVRRDGPKARLFTRRGYDWTERYPAITSAAAKLRAKSFTMDGEAVVCGPDGIALFDAGALTLFGLTRWGKVFWPRRRVSHQWCGDIQSIQLRSLQLCPLS